MTDGAAGIAVVRGIVHARVIQRRLQHSGWKVDVIHLRVVVGVHRLRRHLPLGSVERLADLVELPVRFKGDGMHCILEIVAARNRDAAVVAPAIRIANLVDHRGQFCERLLLGCGAHPRKRLDIVVHRLFDLSGHQQSRVLEFWSEGASDEFLTQGFAEQRVDLPHAALPARLLLRHAPQCAVEEREALGLEAARQERGGRVNGMPAQVGLQIVECGGRE